MAIVKKYLPIASLSFQSLCQHNDWKLRERSITVHTVFVLDKTSRIEPAGFSHRKVRLNYPLIFARASVHIMGVPRRVNHHSILRVCNVLQCLFVPTKTTIVCIAKDKIIQFEKNCTREKKIQEKDLHL